MTSVNLPDVVLERGFKNKRQPGMAKMYRKLRFGEWMQVGVHQDVISGSPQAPREIQAQLKEVFGERAAKLVLAIHPLFKRWTLFEQFNYKGQKMFAPVSVFMTEAKEGVLPVDLQGRGLDHLTGQIGEFRLPNKNDFAIIEKFDVKKYGADAINQMLHEQEVGRLRQTQKDFENDTLAFHLDNFWLAMRDAQAHYSQPWSTREVEVKKNPKKWKITKKNGYTIRERVYGEEGEENAKKDIDNPALLYAHEEEVLEQINGANDGSSNQKNSVPRERNKDGGVLRREASVEQGNKKK